MSGLERIEAEAMQDCAALSGGIVEQAGGALCLAHPTLPATELNRALPLEEAIDLDAIEAFYAETGTPYAVSVVPARAKLARELAERGYRPGYAWMKFERGDEPAAAVETDLRVEESRDAAAFGLAGSEGFGMPSNGALLFAAVVGRPGWHCFVGWDGDEPAAAGALYADGATAWFGMAGTRPAFRRRGAQSAIMRARIETGRALGVTTFTTETGERVPDRPSSSYRNILRAGFREAYLRANWLPPET